MAENTAHSYFPDSDALIDRLDALQKAARDYRNAQASMRQHSVEWEQRLGSPAEVEFGMQVASMTLMLAGDALSAQELLQAEQTNLISAQDMTNLSLARSQCDAQSHQKENSKGHHRSC